MSEEPEKVGLKEHVKRLATSLDKLGEIISDHEKRISELESEF